MGSLDKSYLHCVMSDNVQDAIDVPAEQAFKEGYIGITADYYVKIMNWRSEVEQEIRNGQ